MPCMPGICMGITTGAEAGTVTGGGAAIAGGAPSPICETSRVHACADKSKRWHLRKYLKRNSLPREKLCS